MAVDERWVAAVEAERGDERAAVGEGEPAERDELEKDVVAVVLAERAGERAPRLIERGARTDDPISFDVLVVLGVVAVVGDRGGVGRGGEREALKAVHVTPKSRGARALSRSSYRASRDALNLSAGVGRKAGPPVLLARHLRGVLFAQVESDGEDERILVMRATL